MKNLKTLTDHLNKKVPQKPNVAVILPSRGLAFSETIDEVLRELKLARVDWNIYWSHGRQVPNCLNIPTERALKDKKVTHLWFVDDDMILPRGVLKELIKEDRHAIGCDYPVAITMGSTMYDPDGRAYFCGNGCLLVQRKTIENMKRPIWRSDVGWQIIWHNDGLEFVAGSQNPDKVYGGHDVNFGIRLYTNGQPLYVSKMVCGQRRVAKQPDFTRNGGGSYTIDKWQRFHPNVFYIINQQEKKDRTSLQDIVRVVLKDGTETFVTRDFAVKLHKRDQLSQFGYAIFTNWDIYNEKVIK